MSHSSHSHDAMSLIEGISPTGYDRKVQHVRSMGLPEGKTCLHIERDGDHMISMAFSDGTFAVMLHHQDCCESVEIEDINGDLEDLVGEPLLVFEERTQHNPNEDHGSGTWTFYCLRTIKGSVDIRWYGSSNGYYSERASVDIYQPDPPLTNHEQVAFARDLLLWAAKRRQ